MSYFKLLMPKYFDNRHRRAVKVCLNKIFRNSSSLNSEISKIITGYSHTSKLTNGSYLVSSDLRFFVVQKLLSNHWCLGWFTDYKIAFFGGTVKYVPNLMRLGKIQRKRINFPFSKYPSVSIRKKNFYLQCEKVVPVNPSIRLFSQILGELF